MPPSATHVVMARLAGHSTKKAKAKVALVLRVSNPFSFYQIVRNRAMFIAI